MRSREEANREAARRVAESDPAWMGVEPAGEFLGLEGRVAYYLVFFSIFNKIIALIFKLFIEI